jgi:hypothetical protein
VIIGRRTLIVAGGAFLCAPSLQAGADPAAPAAKPSLIGIPPGKTLGFAVVRNKSKIGTHVLTFAGEGGDLTVKVAVELSVGIGPIALFRYTHKATEVWKNGQLFSLDTETNDDGKPNKVTGRRTDSGFTVVGTKAPLYTAPEDALPATHWNRHMLDGPMINTQDGRLMRPTVTPKGSDAIPTANGGTIMADHFALTGEVMLDTWYDKTPNWVGLSFKAPDGSEVIYERV